MKHIAIVMMFVTCLAISAFACDAFGIDSTYEESGLAGMGLDKSFSGLLCLTYNDSDKYVG